MTVVYHLKKGITKTLENVDAVKVGGKLISPVYTVDKIKDFFFDSSQDIIIVYSGRTLCIAKNTLETLELY